MPLRLINAQHVEPHLCQNSGWNYVTEHIMSMTHNVSCPRIIFLDLFIDQSFLWRHPLNGEDLPHRQHPWFGFIHHPPGVQNSCDNLFASVTFQDALHQCIALIVFSSALQCHVQALLQLWSLCHRRQEYYRKPLPLVYFVSHPVNVDLLSRYRTDDQTSTLPRHRLLHVGHHGREIEKFYRLSAPAFEKIILTNDFPLVRHTCRSIDNTAYREESALVNLRAFHPLLNTRPKRGSVAYSWTCQHQPCRALPRLSCKQYTAALSRGILYVHLTDASAVNTLLECVVLQTPVFVNKLPAVVELLGIRYPLYADSEKVVAEMLQLDTIGIIIEETIDYLARLDLDRFNIRHLMDLIRETVDRYSHGICMMDVIYELDHATPSQLLCEGGSGFRQEFQLLMEPAGKRAQERRHGIQVENDGEISSELSIIDLYM